MIPDNFLGSCITHCYYSLFLSHNSLLSLAAFSCVPCLWDYARWESDSVYIRRLVCNVLNLITKLWKYGYIRSLQQKTHNGVIITTEARLSGMGWGWRINHVTTSWCINIMLVGWSLTVRKGFKNILIDWIIVQNCSCGVPVYHPSLEKKTIQHFSFNSKIMCQVFRILLWIWH